MKKVVLFILTVCLTFISACDGKINSNQSVRRESVDRCKKALERLGQFSESEGYVD
ncbi:hypothetical protein D3C76_1817550 [compost metagenome]